MGRRKRSRVRRAILYIILAGILGVIGFYGYRLLFLKNFATQSQSAITAQLDEARLALSNFDPESAHDSFVAIDEEVNDISLEANKFGVLSFASLFSKFKTLPDMLRDATGISGTAVHIADDITYLKENAIELMLDGRGPELIERLKIFKEKLATLTDYINSLSEQKDSFDAAAQKKISKLRSEIDSSTKTLTALITFLDKEEPRHLLVLFQNPTEMRPAGGFIGSYAHITITEGSVGEIDVRDIYDPDGWVEAKVIPPKTLQLITDTWEARDANWFFDFPTSAKKVIYFLNNSRIYSEHGITFSGAIALNTTVLTDIIGLIGEISLPEYDTTITAENFLTFVQKEVESGPEKKINQPKRILQVLTPKILERLSSLTDSEKQELVSLFEYHFNHKNVFAYVDNNDLQQFSKSIGLAGEVATPSTKAVSEYLAVVNTNIAGGKSDAFIRQKIDLESSISETGEITNNLTITRTHTGAGQKEWWYRATNKNYLQVYTTVGSQALASTGRDKWPTPVKRNYKGFVPDPDIEAIESTEHYLDDLGIDRFIAFDKTVFAAWLNTPAGKTKTFTLTYKNPRKIDRAAKVPYEFIFEKQSGASTTLSIVVDAPSGYKWKESNGANLRYESNDPPGRVRIRQTLIPIR